MTSCAEAIRLLYDRIDGILDPEGNKRLQDHLKSCPSCAQAHEEALSLHALYSSQMVVEPPEELGDRIMSEILAQMPTAAPKRFVWAYWERTLAFAQCALAFILIYFSAPYLSQFKPLWSRFPFPRQIWQIDLSFIKPIHLPDVSFLALSLATRITQVMTEFSQSFASGLQPNLVFVVAGLFLLQIIGNKLLFSSLRS